jgi:hypothetical protein
MNPRNENKGRLHREQKNARKAMIMDELVPVYRHKQSVDKGDGTGGLYGSYAKRIYIENIDIRKLNIDTINQVISTRSNEGVFYNPDTWHTLYTSKGIYRLYKDTDKYYTAKETATARETTTTTTTLYTMDITDGELMRVSLTTDSAKVPTLNLLIDTSKMVRRPLPQFCLPCDYTYVSNRVDTFKLSKQGSTSFVIVYHPTKNDSIQDFYFTTENGIIDKTTAVAATSTRSTTTFANDKPDASNLDVMTHSLKTDIATFLRIFKLVG